MAIEYIDLFIFNYQARNFLHLVFNFIDMANRWDGMGQVQDSSIGLQVKMGSSIKKGHFKQLRNMFG